MKIFSRTDQSIIGQWWWTVDRSLLAALSGLIIYGIVLVTAASPSVAVRIGVDHYHFVIRHLVVMSVAIMLMIWISMLTPQKIWRLASVMLGVGITLMVVVLFVGTEIKGAQRWIHLPGFSLQPSEFIKPAFAVFVAWLFARQKEQPGFPGNILSAGIFFIVVALLLLQPDFGMTVIVSCMFAGQVFLAGLPFRYFLLFFIFGVISVFAAYHLLGHVQSRIDRFIDPSSGDNYQIEKSLEAFKNGGFMGTGAGQGEVKLKIPDAHADFIFSVAGEELGLIFVLPLIGLYAYIILRIFNRLMDSNDIFTVLAVAGLIINFGLQAFVHMGSAVNLLPTKGMTLPFISYGGSSTLSIAVTIGMVLALTKRQIRGGIAKLGLSQSGSGIKLWS